MPPKSPFQAKDLTRVFSYIRHKIDPQSNGSPTSSQQASTDDNPNNNFSAYSKSNSVPNYISTAQNNKPITRFTDSINTRTFEQDSFLQRLGITVKTPSPKNKIEADESKPKTFEQKLKFDDEFSSSQRSDIIDGVNNLIQRKSTHSLVKDVLKTSTQSEEFDTISFTAAKPPLLALTLANSGDVFSPKNNNILEIHDVDSQTPKEEAVKSFVRASTYAYQKEMTDNKKTEEIYDNLSLGNAFLRDVLEHNDSIQVQKIYSNVLGACFVNSENSDEEQTKAVKALHANVIAEMALNPLETKKNFPNAVKEIEEVHQRYNHAKENSKGISSSKLIR